MRVLLTVLAVLVACDATAGEWTRLPSLPDAEGFAGSFAGVSGGALLVAGGANFPDKKPWEGGRKVWYDDVFVLESPDAVWKKVGALPRRLAYGVGVTHRDDLVCVCGSDAERHTADGFRLTWKDGRLTTSKLPALPRPLANAAGALVGDVLYVAGGQERSDGPALNAAYSLDLSATEPTWQTIADCPGPGRMLSVAASRDGAFWLVGGVTLVAGEDDKPARRYLSDAYRYKPGEGWKRIADLPHPLAAAPSPAPVDARGFVVLGGDDGSQVSVDPRQHSGFSRRRWHYDVAADRWSEQGEVAAPRVTTSCVPWRGDWITPTGEMRPGVRSPEVWAWTSEEQR